MSSVTNYENGFWEEQLKDEYNRHIKPVRFNQIVGAIDIYVIRNQLRADYWFTNKKRIYIRSQNKGRIYWQGKLLERDYRGESLSSSEVFKERYHTVLCLN